ncbi:hypothetical protein [Solimonas flava]|uniref:hypothetical protein n=1 Tax=Solimonas flava TaxID=415849 RepID=UPI0012B65DE5|nr:hypothetical protein [Solimonas flava]
MIVRHEKFNSGWIGLAVELTASDIERMIKKLSDLKDGRLQHFHWRTDDFSKNEGVADVEFSLGTHAGHGNMEIE